MGLTSSIFFFCLILFLVVERLAELRAAKRNFARLKSLGGKEFGVSHYPVIVAMHVAFFISMVLEFVLRGGELAVYWPLPLALFLLGQGIRLWGRRTMRNRWTTRVIVVKGEHLIRSGPYKVIPHPIYVAVILELLSLPLIFNLYVTSILFSVLNGIMLFRVRIPTERAALDWSQGKES